MKIELSFTTSNNAHLEKTTTLTFLSDLDFPSLVT